MTARLLAIATGVALLAAATALASPSMTRSRARQLARAVNLTRSDMAGYDHLSGSNAPNEDIWGSKVYARCAGRKAYGKDLADISSDAFERTSSDGDVSDFQSETEVLPNATLARRDIAIARSARGLRCLLKQVRAVAPPSVLKGVTITRMQPPVPHGVGLHVVMQVAGGSGTQTLYSDVLVIQQRQVESALLALSRPNPPARADEDRLLGILSTRLDSQLNPDTLL